MKIAIITDTHWGARNDSQVFTDYFAKFYENIFFPTLEKRGIRTVIHMGDIVDRRKFINYKTLFQMRHHFFDACYGRYINLHMIIGNHDTFFKNTNSLNSMDCLRLHDDHQVHIYEEPTEVDFDGLKCLMMPWICDENREQSLKAIQDTEAQILFGHLEVKGFEMHMGSWNQEGVDASLFKKFDMAMSGHFHHKSDNGNVYYLGNPYEITWSDYNDPRGFHIFDTETREAEFIKNEYRLFEKIYYDDENWSRDFRSLDTSYYKDKIVKLIVENKTKIPEFETFLDRLYKSNPIDLIILEDLSEYTARYADDEGEDLEVGNTATFLNEYVDSMPVDFEKHAERTKVKKLLQVIYDEALNTDE